MCDIVEFHLGKLYNDLAAKQANGEMTEEEMESKMEELRMLPANKLRKKYEDFVRSKKNKN